MRPDELERSAAWTPSAGGRDRLLLVEPATRTFGELLIDAEEDRTLRAALVGMLREAEGGP